MKSIEGAHGHNPKLQLDTLKNCAHVILAPIPGKNRKLKKNNAILKTRGSIPIAKTSAKALVNKRDNRLGILVVC